MANIIPFAFRGELFSGTHDFSSGGFIQHRRHTPVRRRNPPFPPDSWGAPPELAPPTLHRRFVWRPKYTWNDFGTFGFRAGKRGFHKRFVLLPKYTWLIFGGFGFLFEDFVRMVQILKKPCGGFFAKYFFSMVDHVTPSDVIVQVDPSFENFENPSNIYK